MASEERRKQPWCQPASPQWTSWDATPWQGQGWTSYGAGNGYAGNGYHSDGRTSWNDLKPVDRKDVKGPETYTGDITLWMSWSKSFMRFLRRKD